MLAMKTVKEINNHFKKGDLKKAYSAFNASLRRTYALYETAVVPSKELMIFRETFTKARSPVETTDLQVLTETNEQVFHEIEKTKQTPPFKQAQYGQLDYIKSLKDY